MTDMPTPPANPSSGLDDWQTHPDRPPPGTRLCGIDEIPDGGGHVLSFGAGNPPFRMLLLRSGEGVRAWHNHCPHFGQPLALKDEWLIVKPHVSFSCNVHYARFRWQDGVCEFGDCVGERLAAIPVTVRDGAILID